MNTSGEQLIARLRMGLQTSRELQTALRLSQPRISQLLRRTPGIVTLGAARSTRYGIRRSIRNNAQPIPLYRVGAESDATLTRVGELLPLAPENTGDVLVRWEDAAGAHEFLHEGMPWFLADMRPQGFLGRFFPRQYPELKMPPDISNWNNDDTLFALSEQGWDAPGDWIIGEAAAARRLAERHASLESTQLGGSLVGENERSAQFPRLAEQVMAGAPPGSSAGGEQPKFLCRVRGAGDAVRAVIVKFSPRVDTAAGRRWADLLCAEHIALRTLAEAGIEVAKTRLLDAGGRIFLEVERFDRAGAFGRLPTVSFGALADYLGVRDTWSAMATAFARTGLIESATLSRVRLLAAFAACIHNSDTHAGNLSLLAASPVPVLGAPEKFSLAPVYDMLPMDYRPRADNSMPSGALPSPVPLPEYLEEWDEALGIARRFRENLARFPLISEEFRRLWF